jgi:DNA mismatch endonuclease (patch repair protein)
MPDTYDSETRSRVMRQVKGRDTKPELLLRHTLWSSGLRGYRLHRKDLPGKPDVAFVGRRVAVFVDGAWWHGHPDKWWPGRSGAYWDRKVQGNIDRDRRVDDELNSMGWTVVRFWDFEVLADSKRCRDLVATALGSSGQRGRYRGRSRV